MKFFKIECNVFKFDVLVVSNCTYAELRSYLKNSYRCHIDEDPGEFTIGTVLTFTRNPYRVLWTHKWEDKACLIHELFHLTTRICYDRGIKIVAQNEDGSNGDEPAAYLLEFLITQCLKRK